MYFGGPGSGQASFRWPRPLRPSKHEPDSGRIDLSARGQSGSRVDLHRVEHLVLDEADRMLDPALFDRVQRGIELEYGEKGFKVGVGLRQLIPLDYSMMDLADAAPLVFSARAAWAGLVAAPSRRRSPSRWRGCFRLPVFGSWLSSVTIAERMPEIRCGV